MLIRLVVSLSLIATGFVYILSGILGIGLPPLELVVSEGGLSTISRIDTYLSVIIGIVMTALGRFVWKNYTRSSNNSDRLDRHGLVIFGDDQNPIRDGLIHKQKEIEKRLSKVEGRLNALESRLENLDT